MEHVHVNVALVVYAMSGNQSCICGVSATLVMYAQNHVFSSVMHQYDVRLPYPDIVYRQ